MITVKQLATMRPSSWMSDAAARGAGTLTFYASRSGIVSSYFRYTDSTGRTDRLALGAFDETGRAGYTLTELRERAGVLSRLYLSGVRDLRHHFEEQERQAKEAEESRQKAQEAARQAEERMAREREQFTLRRLGEAYIAHLVAKGRARTADVTSAFKVHVYAYPAIADLPAKDVTSDHVATLVRQVQEKGKARMAGVVRSYLNAAFTCAAKARYDHTLPVSFVDFGVEQNPVAVIPANSGVVPGERVLSREELAAYLRRLFGPDLSDQILLLHLLAAGQRMSQLLRARLADFDPAESTLRLWDGKGKRKVAREHILPLAPLAAEVVGVLAERAKAVEEQRAQEEGRKPDPNPSLFPSIGGSVVHPQTPGKRLNEIARDMGGALFDLGDIRRTTETMLAALKVNRDTRAQLLSHGISGVQAVHYDRFSYSDEKADALETWERFMGELLEEPATGAKVIPMRRRRRA